MPDDGQGGTPDTSGGMPGATDGKTTEGTQQPPEGETPEGNTDGKSGGAEDTAALRKAIREERDARKAAEAKLREVTEKDLPAIAKAERRNAELEEENARLASELVLRDVATEVAKAAAKVGVIDVDVVMVLLREADTIDFDAEGRPVNVEAAIKDLVKNKPYLVKPGSAGADAGAGTRPGAAPGKSMNDLIRRTAGRQ